MLVPHHTCQLPQGGLCQVSQLICELRQLPARTSWFQQQYTLCTVDGTQYADGSELLHNA